MLKKYFPAGLWSGIVFLLLVSCFSPFNIPEKIHVQGQTSVALPLGGSEFIISEYLSTEQIQSGFGDLMQVYDWAGSPAGTDGSRIQTYLLHYSLEEVAYDLSDEEFDFNPGGAHQVPFDPVTVPDLNVIPIFPASLSSSPFPLGLSGFTEAQVAQGAIVLESFPVSGDSFAGRTINLTSLSSGEGPQTLTCGNDGRTFSLADKKIYGDTAITISGSTVTAYVALNIQRYANIEIPYTVSLSDTITVGFGGMADWVKSITFEEISLALAFNTRIDGLKITLDPVTEFGITGGTEITGSDAYQDGIKFQGRPPAGGTPAAELGQFFLTDNGNRPGATPFGTAKTVNFTFTVTSDANKIKIYDVAPGDQISDPITPTPEFRWTSAEIYPGQVTDNMAGSFPDGAEGFDMSQLTSAVGDAVNVNNIDFDNVNVNLYVNGPRSVLGVTKITLATRIGSAPPNNIASDQALQNVNPLTTAPDFDSLAVEGVYSGSLPGAQYATSGFTPVFSQKPESLFIDYELTIAGEETVSITPAGDSRRITLKPDIVIELPLKFRLRSQTTDPEGIATLTINGLGEDGEDLLGRTGEDDDSFDLVNSITLDITYTNTIGLGSSSIYLNIGENFHQPLLTLAPDQPNSREVTLTSNDLVFPFTPNVVLQVLAEETDGQGRKYGVIEIKRGTEEIPAGLNVSLSLRAVADIDEEFAF
jgi:hypothetical protein